MIRSFIVAVALALTACSGERNFAASSGSITLKGGMTHQCDEIISMQSSVVCFKYSRKLEFDRSAVESIRQ